MARTAYQFVKSLGFASEVALGMESLSPKFMSSPVSKSLARSKGFEEALDKFCNRSDGTSGREADVKVEMLDHQQMVSQHISPEQILYSNPNSKIIDNCSEMENNCLRSPENSINVNQLDPNINFGISSPLELVSFESLRDFKTIFEPYPQAPYIKKALYDYPVSRKGEYEKEYLGQHEHLSKLIKSEPVESTEYSILEKGVACFLKKCREEIDPDTSISNRSPDRAIRSCKSEELSTSSHNDTGIGSFEDEDLSISEEYLDGRGIQYVSEMNGTALRLKKLSKTADQLKTIQMSATLREKVMDFEANLNYLKDQSKELKSKIKLRNRRVQKSYYRSRSVSNLPV